MLVEQSLLNCNTEPDPVSFELDSGPSFPTTVCNRLFYKTDNADGNGIVGLYVYVNGWIFVGPDSNADLTYGPTFPTNPFDAQLFLLTSSIETPGLYAYINNQWTYTTIQPVTSVNGKTGAVTLNVSDLGPISASQITTGTLPPDQLPAFTGDATVAQGTTSIVLDIVNLNVGTFAGISVNAKGLVTGANHLTTLADYGITDALSGAHLGQPNGLATLDSSGKLNGNQIPSSLVGAVVYQGVWNAHTNVPIIVSGRGTKGFYYIVSAEGTTSVDGNSVWNIGDAIIFNGVSWNRLDGPLTIGYSLNAVTSINGQTGDVVLNATDIPGYLDPTNAASISTGTLSASILPAFTGDATIAHGTTSIVFDTVNANVGTFNGITVNAKGLVTGATNLMAHANGIATLDVNSLLNVNQVPAFTGDATVHQGTTLITFNSINSVPGNYNNVVVNAKGLVTSGSNVSYLIGNEPITFIGDATGSGTTSVSLTLSDSGVTASTVNTILSNLMLTVNAKGIVTDLIEIYAVNKAYTYDTSNKILTEITTFSNSSTASSTYTYNTNGLVDTITRVNGAVTITETYIYDAGNNISNIGIVKT